MASLNKVILIGHLTADPELKQTPSGVSVTSFSIGVTRRFQRQGEQPQSDFINIVAWSRIYNEIFQKRQCHMHLRFYSDKNMDGK